MHHFDVSIRRGNLTSVLTLFHLGHPTRSSLWPYLMHHTFGSAVGRCDYDLLPDSLWVISRFSRDFTIWSLISCPMSWQLLLLCRTCSIDSLWGRLKLVLRTLYLSRLVVEKVLLNSCVYSHISCRRALHTPLSHQCKLLEVTLVNGLIFCHWRFHMEDSWFHNYWI